MSPILKGGSSLSAMGHVVTGNLYLLMLYIAREKLGKKENREAHEQRVETWNYF